MMEEADLLKERLQAITDKRRVQEDIAKKRREIEEEKLKLQYIKKKALREQWLMDGLSQQSQEEQETMRLQAQDEQEQSDQLQSNIRRIEKEIEALETQELNISTNEEVILKRLKEVEKTAEDIIKELNAEFQPDVTRHVASPLPDVPLRVKQAAPKNPPKQDPGGDAQKKAMFAMEISVEHDMRTGESQVVSMATITPETVQERGVKVYDDGCKSVYALHPDGRKIHNGVVGEMTSLEVEELLLQATDKKVPSEVQYHQPVYSAPYIGTSRPSTPRTSSKTPRQTPTPSSSPFQTKIVPRNGTQNLGEESQLSQEVDGRKSPRKTPSPGPFQKDTILRDRSQRQEDEIQQSLSHIPGQAHTKGHQTPQPQSPHFGSITPQRLTSRHTDASGPSQAALVAVTARSEGMPTVIQPVYRNIDTLSPLLAGHKSAACHDPVPLIESSADYDRQSPLYPESEASLNLVNSLSEDLESEPVTMIFMGYQNAEEDEEEEDIQAELVIIGNSDDDDDEEEGENAENGKNDNGGDELLSYHPEGYKSKVFRPKVGIAKVGGCRDIIEEVYMNCDDLLPHKPTFIHKPGRSSPCLTGQEIEEPTSQGSINQEKMKLCSTGR